jgi:Undecaprenyl-phosphate glucose phosphotransferase
MIKRWQKTLNSINRLLDTLLLFVSYFAAVYIWLIVIRKSPNNIALTFSQSVWGALALSLIIVLLYQLTGLYDSVRAKPFGNDVKRVLLINAIASILVAALLFVFRLEDFSRGAIALFYLVSCISVLGKRALVRHILSLYRSKGYNLKHVILIGNGSLAQKYIDTIQKYPRFGFTIDGYIGCAQTILGTTYLGTWEQSGNEQLSKPGVDEVVVALHQEEFMLLPQIIAATEKHGTKVSIIPYFNEYIPSSTTLETLGDCKLLNVRSIPLDSPVNAILKRAIDIFAALILILLTSPIMLAAVIGVKLSSPGPIIFRQTRVGRNKKLFQMYKFRSMRVNSQESTGWTKQDDPRKTKFGSFIRKTSIDELPQFFNVLKGDMSLVGPRPEIPHFVEQFKETIPLYMLKHLVRPGITGWAQVHGYRGDTSISGRIQHDIWYIEHWSLGLDVRTIFLTAFGGFINNEGVKKK